MKNNLWSLPQKLENILLYGLAGILFLPIIIFPPNFQPSDWSRSMLFRIIIAILFSAILYYLLHKKNLAITVPKYGLKTYLPLILLAGFMIVSIISTIFSQDIFFSLFGSPSRAGGMVNLFFFFIFTVILTFFTKNNWEKLFSVLFVVGALASFFAIFQSVNFFTGKLISYTSGSVPSFLGNSTILAIYMLFLAFWAFVYFIEAQTK